MQKNSEVKFTSLFLYYAESVVSAETARLKAVCRIRASRKSPIRQKPIR